MTYLDEIEARCCAFKFGSDHYRHDVIAALHAAESELDHVYSEIVPVLLNRLHFVILELRKIADVAKRKMPLHQDYLNELADLLSGPPTEEELK